MTTNNDHRVSKLYDALTSGEKAAAVFACLMRFDTATADRIIATVPTRTYRTLDLDYGDRLSRLSDMSSFWGLHHWREMTVMMAAMALIVAPGRPGTTIWVSKPLRASRKRKLTWSPSMPCWWTSATRTAWTKKPFG